MLTPCLLQVQVEMIMPHELEVLRWADLIHASSYMLQLLSSSGIIIMLPAKP
jgi:hypothetical protein